MIYLSVHETGWLSRERFMIVAVCPWSWVTLLGGHVCFSLPMALNGSPGRSWLFQSAYGSKRLSWEVMIVSVCLWPWMALWGSHDCFCLPVRLYCLTWQWNRRYMFEGHPSGMGHISVYTPIGVSADYFFRSTFRFRDVMIVVCCSQSMAVDC